MKYRGCIGSVCFSAADGVFHGMILGIRDLVTYEAPDAASLEESFREAVRDYLRGYDAGN